MWARNMPHRCGSSLPLGSLFAAFQAAHEKACAFRRKVTGVEEATATTVVRAGQRAAIDRFGLLSIEGAG
jgi:hypothetical protein